MVDYSKKIWDYLMKVIRNPYGVAGLMGNLKAESGLIPIRIQGDFDIKSDYQPSKTYTSNIDNHVISEYDFVHNGPHGGGYGLAQWTSAGRKQGLYNNTVKVGISIGDIDAQLDYLYYELCNSYKSVLNALKSATSVRQASDVVLTKFERPKDQSTKVQETRAGLGQAYFDQFYVATSQSEKEVTMSTSAQKLINIALAEEGYIEKKSGDLNYLYDKTANAGSANYTKYGYEMHKVYPQTMDYPAEWCDCFVDWCFYKAFGVSTAQSLLGGKFDDYTVNSAQLYKNKGAWYTSNPKAGDQIFFKNSSRICHTGIVVKVDSKYVYTIEGNTSSTAGVVPNGGCVRQKKYAMSYSGIAGYGRPKYDSQSTGSIPSPSVVGIGTNNKLDKVVDYIGIVNTNKLNVRQGAGIQFAKLSSYPTVNYGTELGVCTEVLALDGSKWLYVEINGDKGKKYGFVSATYVVKKKSYEKIDPTKVPDNKITKDVQWNGITTANVNIRSYAGTAYNKLGTIPKGTVVEVCDSVYDSSKVIWYYIKYNGKYGFVHSDYVDRM